MACGLWFLQGSRSIERQMQKAEMEHVAPAALDRLG